LIGRQRIAVRINGKQVAPRVNRSTATGGITVGQRHVGKRHRCAANISIEYSRLIVAADRQHVRTGAEETQPILKKCFLMFYILSKLQIK